VEGLGKRAATHVMRQPDQQVRHIDPCPMEEKQALDHTDRADKRQPEQHPHQRATLLDQA
jgi:hypothetical protein